MQRSDIPTPRTVRNATTAAPARVTRRVKQTAARFERRSVAAELAVAVAELRASDGEEVNA